MGPPAVSLVLVVVLGLTATLPGLTMVHAEGNSAQDLLDNWMNERDTQLTERNPDINTQLNSLGSRQDEVDARLNRMDRRIDNLKTMMSDMKKNFDQRMDTLEVKVESALADTTQTGEVGSQAHKQNKTSQIPKDCQEAYTMGSTASGVYKIAPEPNTQIDVYCEQELNGGGWIVFQLRKDGTVDFYQDWNTYKQGFGELTGEFWLGNTNIQLLTKHRDQQLKIELTSHEGEVIYAEYSHFWVADEAHEYRLNLTGYSGGTSPGDGLSYHSGTGFSTSDQDNDGWSSGSCATKLHGAWWYGNCAKSNLNGRYGGTDDTGMFWSFWNLYSPPLNGTRMMLRKRP